MGLKDTEAIVLRTHKLGEADKIVILLGRDRGVMRGTARGARKIKSRFGASLEPFSHIRLSYFEKESQELVSIRDTEIVRSHFELLGDHTTYILLEYLGELVIEFSPPHEPNEKLFRMVVAALEDLTVSPESRESLARYFEIWTLKLAGFWPELKVCPKCHRSFADKGGVAAFVQSSLLVCTACAGGAGLPLSADAVAQLHSASRQRPGVWAGALQQLPEISQTQIKRVTSQLITRALERPPRGQPRAR